MSSVRTSAARSPKLLRHQATSPRAPGRSPISARVTAIIRRAAVLSLSSCSALSISLIARACLPERALALEQGVIEKLVYDSVALKAAVVNLDELEKGERRKLNLGHTFGHAIEKIHRLPHGEAVSIGMVAAAKLSARKNLLSESDVVRLENLLRRLKLPTRLALQSEEIMGALKKDKKRAGDKMKFVLLRGIGDAVVEEMSVADLEGEAKRLF